MILAVRPLVRASQPKRNPATYGPPSVRVGVGEKALCGFLISLSCLSVPMAVLYNIPTWRESRKAMFAARSMIKIAPQTRQMSAVVSGPPSNQISLVEKLCHGIIMSFACLSLPAYVLANMRRYRGAE